MKFLGGPWTAETRAGTFARFFEAHGGLDRAAFLERIRCPCLVIGAEADPATWDQGIVVRLDRAGSASDVVVVGRGAQADVLLNCPTISKSHARFARSQDGWSVTDLGSATGTTVEGKRLENTQTAPLTAPRPRIELGPDVAATFLLPEQLHAFVEEARARRAAGPQGPARPRNAAGWPTWSLLQEPGPGSDTDHVLPVQRPAIGAAPPRFEPTNKVRKNWRAQAREIARDPRRLAFVTTLVVIAVVAALVYVRPLAVMLFAEHYPEWFSR
ncbi:MAG TPA: FHA domain-containing protein [Planctomycetota bacterium]|nr:FHA domain-containing protein [Planctomycetota bacterium]